MASNGQRVIGGAQSHSNKDSISLVLSSAGAFAGHVLTTADSYLLTDGGGAASLKVDLSRNKDKITLEFGGVHAAAQSTAATFNTAANSLPSGWAPRQDVAATIRVLNNAVIAAAPLVVRADGSIEVGGDLAGGNFTGGGVACAISPFSITYEAPFSV